LAQWEQAMNQLGAVNSFFGFASKECKSITGMFSLAQI
jgi:hypothetical protein